jgi:hypothetical protein
MLIDWEHLLVDASRRALTAHGWFGYEDRRGRIVDQITLREALCMELADMRPVTGLPVRFSRSAIQPPAPPAGIPSIDVCDKGRGTRRCDLLLRSGESTAVIELKYRRHTRWSGTYVGSAVPQQTPVDTYGYYYLKDLHRLERLERVDSSDGPIRPTHRYALFISNDPFEYEGQVPHDALSLRDRTLPAGSVVQYNAHTARGKPTSPKTLWRDYPPFCLANAYRIEWQDLRDDVSRFLPSVGVSKQYPGSKILLQRVLPRGGQHAE